MAEGGIAGSYVEPPRSLKFTLVFLIAILIACIALLANFASGAMGDFDANGRSDDGFGPVDHYASCDGTYEQTTDADGNVFATFTEDDCKSAGEFLCQYIGGHNTRDASNIDPVCALTNVPEFAQTGGQMPFAVVFAAMTAGVFGLVAVTFYAMEVMKRPTGTPMMREIAGFIEEGAHAFLVAEFRYIIMFLIVVFCLMGVATDWRMAGCYMFGGLLSAATGFIGMMIATKGNVRTAAAAEASLSNGLQVAFRSGAVMGLSVVSVGLLGLSLVYLIFQDAKALAGFGAGSSSIALFMRVGGGIYTKAADVGADLVGKVEADIPEDDPRNPATIADNVGDNVGDVAGMGSDLFESFVGSIVASVVLGAQKYGTDGIAIPFWIALIGVVAAVVFTWHVRCKEDSSMDDLLMSLTYNVVGASIVITIGTLLICLSVFDTAKGYEDNIAIDLFLCVFSGLACGVLIGKITEYFTSHTYYPTRSISDSAEFGAGPVIIQGLGQGMFSTVIPLCLVGITVVLAYELQGFYGSAIASVGMLSTLGVTMATDAYGPVADNAGGIAEMSDLPDFVRDRTDLLDALGNTTAATGKGFANGSAVLSALSLMAAFSREARMTEVNLLDRLVIVSMLIGAMLPYIFAALTMLAVNRAAQAMIVEVRRQFREIDGLREGVEGVRADHAKCVDISTKSALSEMVLPGVLACMSPMIIGFWVGLQGLASMLLGAIASGYLLGVMMSNAGGAWDNAKKYVESGAYGADQGKGSERHKAAVSGDTVGDPFKDTSGPSLNILIKLMTRFSFVFVPLFDLVGPNEWPDNWYIGLLLFIATLIVSFLYSLYKHVKEEEAAGKYQRAPSAQVELVATSSDV
eukprot:Rmarinus@m.24570